MVNKHSLIAKITKLLGIQKANICFWICPSLFLSNNSVGETLDSKQYINHLNLRFLKNCLSISCLEALWYIYMYNQLSNSRNWNLRVFFEIWKYWKNFNDVNKILSIKHIAQLSGSKCFESKRARGLLVNIQHCKLLCSL